MTCDCTSTPKSCQGFNPALLALLLSAVTPPYTMWSVLKGSSTVHSPSCPHHDDEYDEHDHDQEHEHDGTRTIITTV